MRVLRAAHRRPSDPERRTSAAFRNGPGTRLLRRAAVPHATALAFLGRLASRAAYGFPVDDDDDTSTIPHSTLTMAPLGILLLAAAAVGSAVASPLQEQEVLFPGVPGGKKWDWKDCGMFIMSRRSCSYNLISL